MQGCWHDNKLEYVVRLRQMLTQFYIIIYIIFSFIVFWNIHKWEGLGVKGRGGGALYEALLLWPRLFYNDLVVSNESESTYTLRR